MGMIKRHRERTAHQSVAAKRAVKARQPTHLKNLPDTFTLFAQQPAVSIKELSLTAGI
ncbi:Uncharacterised protein [Klebsiella pneumoniae]|nr:Uncharacterised protein [Klebsiella pneumoniae]